MRYWLTVVRAAIYGSMHFTLPLLGDVAKATAYAGATWMIVAASGKALVFFGLDNSGATSNAAGAALVIFAFALSVWLCVFLWKLVEVPATFAVATKSELAVCKERLQPRISVTLPTQTAAICFGKTSISRSGSVQTALLTHENVIRLHCKNVSDVSLRSCEARIISASRLIDGVFHDLGIIEDIPLLWDRDLKKEVFSIRLDPSQTKCLYIGAVRQAGNVILWRDTNELPTEYVHLFSDAGIYRLTIMIKSADDAPTVAIVEFMTEAASTEPNIHPKPRIQFRLVEGLRDK